MFLGNIYLSGAKEANPGEMFDTTEPAEPSADPVNYSVEGSSYLKLENPSSKTRYYTDGTKGKKTLDISTVYLKTLSDIDFDNYIFREGQFELNKTEVTGDVNILDNASLDVSNNDYFNIGGDLKGNGKIIAHMEELISVKGKLDGNPEFRTYNSNFLEDCSGVVTEGFTYIKAKDKTDGNDFSFKVNVYNKGLKLVGEKGADGFAWTVRDENYVPIEPEKPVEPSKPIEPEKPVEPSKPIEPEKPEKPNPTISVGQINLDRTQITLKKGEKVQIKAKVIPVSATDKNLKFTSGNSNVATVSQDGMVVAKGPGTTYIKVDALDGSGVSAKMTVNVKYNIKYILNNGKNSSKNPTAYFDEKIILKAPSRKGYTFLGWYTDSKYKNKITAISKGAKKEYTVYARWNKISIAKPKIYKLKNYKKGRAYLSFSKIKGVDGYKIEYSTSKKFSKKYTKSIRTTKTSYKIGKLKKNKTYYVRVRGYKKDSAGYYVYGKTSKIIKIKIKK